MANIDNKDGATADKWNMWPKNLWVSIQPGSSLPIAYLWQLSHKMQENCPFRPSRETPDRFCAESLIRRHGGKEGREEVGERTILESRKPGLQVAEQTNGERAQPLCSPAGAACLVNPLARSPWQRAVLGLQATVKQQRLFSTRRKGQCLWRKHFTTCSFW